MKLVIDNSKIVIEDLQIGDREKLAEKYGEKFVSTAEEMGVVFPKESKRYGSGYFVNTASGIYYLFGVNVSGQHNYADDDKNIWHFWLIAPKDGNRWSDTPIVGTSEGVTIRAIQETCDIVICDIVQSAFSASGIYTTHNKDLKWVAV